MSGQPVLVFGATGRVGSVAARIAQQQGAKVFLGVRDTEKPIPGLTPEQEKSGGFERIQADLTIPDSIQGAVQKTGAKRAFIYLIFGSQDGMKSTITALKSSGIETVVFLSSSGVPDDITSVSPTNFIAYQHAQVERNLQELFGAGRYVAVRPGYFASNSLRWSKMVQDGEVKMAYPNAVFDWISPGDISRVCGSLLARWPEDSDGNFSNVIRIYGPDVVPQSVAVDIIAKALAKEVKVTELDDQEGAEFYMKFIGLPQHSATALVNMLKKRAEIGKSDGGYDGPSYEEGVANIQKYGGSAATAFRQWVEENKGEFGV